MTDRRSSNGFVDTNSTDDIAITLSRDAGLTFDWNVFVSGLAESAANFLIKGWQDGGVSAIANLTKVFSSVSIDEPTEARAWRLIALAFASSLDDLKSKEGLNIENLRSAMRAALDEAKSDLDSGNVNLGRSFLEYPSSSPLYQMMRNHVVNKRAEVGLPEHFSEDLLSAKLDISFNRSVFEVCTRDQSYFVGIQEYFKAIGNRAVSEDISWKNYRQNLQHTFEVSPTFGQEASGISLSQLYVPLRAYWVDYEEEKKAKERYSDSMPSTASIVMLDEALDAWVKANDESDWLRLIGGGPGSGKSTSLKAFASRMAKDESVRTLFVPLQHIGMASDLRLAVNEYFLRRASCHFNYEPLSKRSLQSGAPLVLILDGLDELVAPNENAKEAITVFAHKLNNFASELRGDSAKKVKIIVSGRMAAFQTARQFLTLHASGCLEVYGYAPSADNNRHKVSSLWAIDQRSEWWDRYSGSLQLNTDMPEAFSSEELDSITSEPLLAYLLVLAGFATHNWKKAAENINRIYSALMTDIYRRGWGDGYSKIRSMSSADFHKLMQTIGLGAWLGGDSRIASEALFLKAVKITRAESAWAKFNADKGPDVTNLAMNFYLKASEGSLRGFEFTHKSFGEYLAAVSLLETAIEIRSLPSIRMSFALDEWYTATSTGELTPEVMQFLKREVRLRIEEGGEQVVSILKEVKDSFCSMAGVVNKYGFGKLDSDNIRVLDAHQRNSELATWGMINAISNGMIDIERVEDAKFEIIGLEAFGLVNLITRHHNFFQNRVHITSCFSGLKLQTMLLMGLYGTYLDISYCESMHILIEGSQVSSLITTGIKAGGFTISNCNIGAVTVGSEEIRRLEISESNVPLGPISSITADHKAIDSSSYIRSYDDGLDLERLKVLEFNSGPEELDFHENAIEAISSMRVNGWIQ